MQRLMSRVSTCLPPLATSLTCLLTPSCRWSRQTDRDEKHEHDLLRNRFCRRSRYHPADDPEQPAGARTGRRPGHRCPVLLYGRCVQSGDLLAAAGWIDDIVSGYTVATTLESGGRSHRRMCPVQLCGARAENRVFSPAGAGHCRTITLVTDD